MAKKISSFINSTKGDNNNYNLVNYNKRSVNISKKDVFYDREVKSVPTARILSLVFLILLAVMIFRKFTGNNNTPTFTSFLDMLTNIETPTIPFVNYSFTTLGDWGVFNWLRDFLNVFVDLFNVILFLVNGIISLFQYVTNFILWLYV